jgi:hypothetical protein
MSKRFTDTDKWDDPWFDELENDEKLMWLYLCDKCSIAGIWKVNFKKMRYHCNTEKTNDEICELFKERFIEFSPGKWFIPKFLLFQYPIGLNSQKPAVIAVRNEIFKFNLTSIITKSFPNDYLIIKDKTRLDKTKTRTENTVDVKRIFEENYSDSKYISRPKL